MAIGSRDVDVFLLTFTTYHVLKQPQTWNPWPACSVWKTCSTRRSYVLSTGQKQRAVLARALIHDPPVMLLDEPTRGLDVIGSRTVFEYMQHLRAEGKAVILSTHRLDEAERPLRSLSDSCMKGGCTKKERSTSYAQTLAAHRS